MNKIEEILIPIRISLSIDLNIKHKTNQKAESESEHKNNYGQTNEESIIKNGELTEEQLKYLRQHTIKQFITKFPGCEVDKMRLNYIRSKIKPKQYQ